jgi:hypothetical protein
MFMSLHTKFAAFARLAEWHFLRATGDDYDDYESCVTVTSEVCYI